MATLSHANQEICLVATLPSTPRGARAARALTVAQLAEHKLPFEDAAQVVAELAANAVTHGKVRGRDFRLALHIAPGPTLRIEVSDTRREFGPPAVAEVPAPGAESGRGLVLVSALATRWGTDHGPAPLKTVWAEMDLASPISPDRGFHDPVGRCPVARDA
ncbi:ATP-binding protein [Streptomyces sp. NRRL S-237]|uniref:ATP-binding protein n=1 Tax=Streptomyces sp. NRRL S-237 TaxID=1463895 RepID=UPI000D117903|nr:ATP-binding protein [Streptomyces sp. NRRL S-237]